MTYCEHCNDCPIHALVDALRKRIQELEAELANRDDEMAATESRLERAKAEGRSLKRKLDDQGNDANYSEYARARTLHDIERAMERGDEVDIQRGLEKLKRGW